MRHLSFILLIAGFAVSGCSLHNQSEPETSFFRDFSLAQAVEGMKVPELKSMSGGGGGSTSSGETTRRRRDFNLTYVIEEREGAKFDETGFISKLRDEIERVMRGTDARVDGGGTFDNSFHFDYSTAGHEGWLEVMGVRVEGNRYRLWGVIRENARKGKE